MTIKEKILQAWAQDLKVVVIVDTGHQERREGWIDYFMGDSVHISYRVNEGGCTVPYSAITDIQFLDGTWVEVDAMPGGRLFRWAGVSKHKEKLCTAGNEDRQVTVWYRKTSDVILKCRGKVAYMHGKDFGIGVDVPDYDEIPIAYDEIVDVVLVKDEKGSTEHNEHNAIYAKLAAVSDRVDDLELVESFVDTAKLLAKIGKLENELHAVVKKVVLDGETEVTEKPHDIAKERWWFEPECGEILCHEKEVGGRIIASYRDYDAGTDVRIELATAAPELADLSRDAVNNAVKYMQCSEGLAGALIRLIRLLRKLGIPDVAPWYKDEK